MIASFYSIHLFRREKKQIWKTCYRWRWIIFISSNLESRIYNFCFTEIIVTYSSNLETF